MHSKSDNAKIMINDRLEEIVEEIFKSFFSRYQIGLETSMRGSLTSIMLFYCIIKSIN